MWRWFKTAILGIEPTLAKAVSGINSVIDEIEHTAAYHAVKVETASAKAKAQLLIVGVSSKAMAEAQAVADNFKKLVNR